MNLNVLRNHLEKALEENALVVLNPHEVKALIDLIPVPKLDNNQRPAAAGRALTRLRHAHPDAWKQIYVPSSRTRRGQELSQAAHYLRQMFPDEYRLYFEQEKDKIRRSLTSFDNTSGMS